MTKSELLDQLDKDIAYQRSEEKMLDPPERDMEFYYRSGLEYARSLVTKLTSLD